MVRHDTIVDTNGPKVTALDKLNPSQSLCRHHRFHCPNRRSPTRAVVSVSGTYRPGTTLITLSTLWPKPSKGGI